MIDLKKLYEEHKTLSRLCFGGHELIEEIKHPIPNISTLYEPLRNAVASRVDFNAEKPKQNVRLSFGKDLYKNQQTFFEDFHIELTLHLDDSNTNPQYKSNCTTDDNQIDYRTERVKCVEIMIEIWGSKITLFRMLASSFYHEMHHAYEDFQRKLKSENDNNLAKYNIVSNYNYDTNIMASVQNKYAHKLYHILYNIHQTEQRAFISGGIGELDEYARTNIGMFSKQPIDVIARTKAFYNLEKLENEYQELLELDDIEIQNLLLNSFNSRKNLIGFADRDILNALLKFDYKKLSKNNVKFYRFKTYNQLIKFIGIKLDLFKNDFVKSMCEKADMIQARMFHRTTSFG